MIGLNGFQWNVCLSLVLLTILIDGLTSYVKVHGLTMMLIFCGRLDFVGEIVACWFYCSVNVEFLIEMFLLNIY